MMGMTIFFFNFTLCLIFHAFLLSDDYFKINFFDKQFREYHQCVNSLDPDQTQTRHFVAPDLGPNCLQRLSAEDTSISMLVISYR